MISIKHQPSHALLQYHINTDKLSNICSWWNFYKTIQNRMHFFDRNEEFEMKLTFHGDAVLESASSCTANKT